MPEKSGITYTRMPSRPVRVTPAASVCASVSEKQEMPMISSSSTGMRMRESFSMPLSTPLYTTSTVAARNTRNQRIGLPIPVMKPVKYPSAAAAAPAPVRKSARYLSTQPPITQ